MKCSLRPSCSARLPQTPSFGSTLRPLNPITFTRPRVGLGSSAASAAVGAVAGYRTLLSLGRDCETTSILAAAAKAEETVTGFPHAHAVGAALWGGCCVAYSQHPAAIAYLTPQIDLRVCVVVPRVKLSRKTYRSALPGQVHLMKHARHAGLTAGLVFGLATGDVLLVRRSARDHIVAPAVGPFIPGYFPAAKAAEEAGALAFSISGSGPAVVALCGSIDDAMAVEQAVTEAFNAHSIATTSFFAGVGRKRRFEVTRGYSTP